MEYYNEKFEFKIDLTKGKRIKKMPRIAREVQAGVKFIDENDLVLKEIETQNIEIKFVALSRNIKK